jgi:hypothetical protein
MTRAEVAVNGQRMDPTMSFGAWREEVVEEELKIWQSISSSE